MKGLSQEKLAKEAHIGRSLLSAIEAPGMARAFSLEVFFNLTDALDIDLAELIRYSEFREMMKQKNKNAARHLVVKRGAGQIFDPKGM